MKRLQGETDKYTTTLGHFKHTVPINQEEKYLKIQKNIEVFNKKYNIEKTWTIQKYYIWNLLDTSRTGLRRKLISLMHIFKGRKAEYKCTKNKVLRS